MSDYIVSARKYRPESFGALIGQDTIARTLSNSIQRGQLAHAYLFCGPRGVGKTTTARIFAKMINCSNPGPEMEPCGKCESCISFQEGRSYCIHEMDAASNNSVDDIKALMDQVRIPPQVGKYSVYIIDEVHMLSTQAFNAFLKTLEEPPAHAVFILATTEKHKILPTILSRCQTYDFNRISITDIVRNLRDIAGKEGVTIDDRSLHVIAAKADGAMRDALTIFDQTVAFCGTDVRYEDVIRNLNVLDEEYGFSLVEDFLAGDYGKALLTFDEILAKGFNALHFMASLSAHFRNLIVSRTAGLESLLELPDSSKKRYNEQALRCTLQFLYDALAVTTACEQGYKQANSPRLHMEFALMKLSFLNGRTGVTTAPRPVVVAEPAAEPIPVPSPSGQGTGAGHDPSEGVAARGLVNGRGPGLDRAGREAGFSDGTESHGRDLPSEGSAQHQGGAPESEVVTPARTRRKAKTGAALSISAMLEEKEEVAESEAPAQDVPLTAEILADAWPKLSELPMIAGQPRLKNAIAAAKTELSEADGVQKVTFYVTNGAQQKWIQENKLRGMEESFREIVSSRSVRLEVEVLPEDEQGPKKPYMPGEQAMDLMAKNPAVRDFVTELGLDVK